MVKPGFWQIQARVSYRKPNGWTEEAQLPTFYLDPDVQAIRSAEHAESIAEKIIDPFGLYQVCPLAAHVE